MDEENWDQQEVSPGNANLKEKGSETGKKI